MPSNHKSSMILAILFVASSLLQGCSRVDPRVEHVWLEHEQTVEKALGNEPISLDEFDEACLFFQNLTGIPARVELNYLGAMPTHHTPEDLLLWREWYEDHKYKLYWNERTGTVGVRD